MADTVWQFQETKNRFSDVVNKALTEGSQTVTRHSEPDFLKHYRFWRVKKGIDKLPASKRKEPLEQWLREDLMVRFENHLLCIDADTMLIWGAINARL
ncbi:MAG: type II toxin-antitoxin system prevent-host-death family antitoxin [Anaerolineaceae bacterium]|nr:type II toxin-antitoxin system prevent-host-death family antitoxin [Anaerolineaceae bacterium]